MKRPKVSWGFAEDLLECPASEDPVPSIRRAMERIGQVTDVGVDVVRGRTRVGLGQKVSLNVFVTPGSSMLRVEAFADDLWGGGARMGIKKLRRTLAETAEG